MIRRVLFVQGGGKGAHDEWDDKLVKSLEYELGDEYAIRYPRMPAEEDPQYPAWKAALRDEFESLQDGAILVGHSVGGTILISALAEEPAEFRLGGILLVAAPFIGQDGWQSDAIPCFADLYGRLPPAAPVFLYHGAEDKTVPVAHVHLYGKAIPHAVVRICEHGDHQFHNDMSQIARAIRSIPSICAT